MSNLNLLPEEIRSEISLSKTNAQLRHYTFIMIAISIFLLTIFSLVFFFLYTQKQEAIREKGIAEQQLNIKKADFEKAKDLSNRIVLIKKLNKEEVDWIKVLNELSAKTPQSVQMDSFSVQKADPTRVKLTGSAGSDGDIVAFKENLSKSELFSYVDIESISVGKDAEQRDVKVYVLSFSLKFEKVKNEK